jgi:hypothetical protein
LCSRAARRLRQGPATHLRKHASLRRRACLAGFRPVHLPFLPEDLMEERVTVSGGARLFRRLLQLTRTPVRSLRVTGGERSPSRAWVRSRFQGRVECVDVSAPTGRSGDPQWRMERNMLGMRVP